MFDRLCKTIYFDSYGFKLVTQTKPCVPNVMCKTCVESLRLWVAKRPFFRYQTPMVWREPLKHQDDSYFCVVNIIRINKNNRYLSRFTRTYDMLLDLLQVEECVFIEAIYIY